MGIGVSGASESGHKKDSGIPAPREKKGILAGAIAGANIPVTFDQKSSSPILESGKSVSAASGKRGGGQLKNISTRGASSAGRSKKARGKSTKKASKSKKSGSIEDLEETPAEEEEIHETEEKGIEAVLEIADFKKEDQQQGKREELFSRLERMAREGPITDLQDIIDTAWGKKGVYEDVTEAYDGLRAAQQYFGEKEEELLKNLSHSTRAAGDIVYKENGPDIRAGYLFGPGTDATLSYREHVLRFEKVSDTFQAIMVKAEGDSRLFTKEIDKLIKGIQIDIKAQESTLDPNHLTQIMQGLYRVQMCSQLEKESGFLLRDRQSIYGAKKLQPTPTIDNKKHIPSVEFSKKILDLAEASWIDADEFEVFNVMAEVQPGKDKVDFSQRFLAIIKRLPEKLVSLERKQKLIEAGQDYLDQVIEEEERLEDEKENHHKPS